MLSVASMMSLNEMDNFEFDDEKRSSMKKINRLSGSANLNDTGKYVCLCDPILTNVPIHFNAFYYSLAISVEYHEASKRRGTHLMSFVFFCTSWNHQKSSSFLMFSGGIETDQWHEMY